MTCMQFFLFYLPLKVSQYKKTTVNLEKRLNDKETESSGLFRNLASKDSDLFRNLASKVTTINKEGCEAAIGEMDNSEEVSYD